MISELLTGPRVEAFWVELLDVDDNPIRVLDGISDTTVAQNWDSTIRGGIQFSLHAQGNEDVNWMQNRFRPWIWSNGMSWPVGVFLPTSPTAKYSETSKTWDVSGLDKTSILDEDKVLQTYSVAKGAIITDVVRTLIESVGETRVALTPSVKVARDLMVWEPGTSILAIINDLFDHINYEHLWADKTGQFRAEPYIESQARPVSAVFAEGDASIHSPVFARTQDVTGVPNRVVLVTAGTDEAPALTAIATNTNPDSPYSYQSRGNRWVTRTYTGVEAADQATLNSLASKYLWTAATPIAYLDVSHAIVSLDLGNVVQFISDDVDVLALVNEYTIPLEVGALMTGKWQELAS